MKTGAAIVGFVFAGAMGLAVGYSLGSSKSSKLKVAPTATKTDKPADGAVPGQVEVLKVPIGGSAVKGPEDALVTIIEFSDFQCPFCSRVGPTMQQIEREYGPKVRVAFKHNPLPFHKEAPLASEYCLAAGEQGKFWEMHDKLFANQTALQPEQLDGYVRDLGLDLSKVQAYVTSGKGKAQIQADQALANSLGARGTPAFFINGVKLSGAQPFPNFKKIIDERLAIAEQMVGSGVAKREVYGKIMATAKAQASPEQPQQPQQQPPQTRQNIALVDGTPQKGASAPLVTIVEWSDFECPFCSRVGPTVKEILQKYPDKVQIQFRHQPLTFHPRAKPAAQATFAAHKQGKFWEMHDKLFDNQKALGDAELTSYAQSLGLSMSRFESDMKSSEAESRIKLDMEDGTKYGARGTPSFFVNGIPVRGAQPFPAFQVVIDKEIELAEKLLKEGVSKSKLYEEIMKREAGKVIAGAAPAGGPAPDAPPPAPTGPVDVKVGRAPLKGSTGAPIQLIVYSDFECPFCSRVNPSIEEVTKKYGSKLSVAFKHYPLPFHRNAELAAVASLAAHRQGKFWPMHDKLFGNQKALLRENLVGYAEELRLDVERFKKNIDDPSLKAWVQEDLNEGQKYGVRGTPATFVNGRLVSGAQPASAFEAIIEEELKKKS